jgi:hypothetical protein
MPRIAVIAGIIVMMKYESKHDLPHIHVRYGRYRASIQVEPFLVLAGELPVSQMRTLREWCERHQAELLENWALARQYLPLKRIGE